MVDKVIKLEEEQHKQAIAHDDEQAKGALVDKEGPDHSGCDSGQSRQRPSSRLKRLEASPDVWPASGIEEVIFEMIFSALVVQDKENIVPSTAKC